MPSRFSREEHDHDTASGRTACVRYLYVSLHDSADTELGADRLHSPSAGLHGNLPYHMDPQRHGPARTKSTCNGYTQGVILVLYRGWKTAGWKWGRLGQIRISVTSVATAGDAPAMRAIGHSQRKALSGTVHGHLCRCMERIMQPYKHLGRATPACSSTAAGCHRSAR